MNSDNYFDLSTLEKNYEEFVGRVLADNKWSDETKEYIAREAVKKIVSLNKKISKPNVIMERDEYDKLMGMFK